ncbi:hypothetical protein D9758_006453 [Tetrapyrgos nigripes]|uniref:F-box domain-containing protein n=1 Tax=Tetrapyrgos nigripes TaxID=182062 RepID=A0A8H5LRE7_9AGAR|nr:hypothetical protein D9758_006453 [Tetrapyrgos nigripes]
MSNSQDCSQTVQNSDPCFYCLPYHSKSYTYPNDLIHVNQLVTEISSVDAELERVQNLLHSLQFRRAHLSSHLNTARSPISRLPNEVLEMVFSILCCEDNADELGEFCLNLHPGRHPAWVLSHVCSLWRNITMSLPKLWSRMEIQVEKVTDVLDEGIRCMEYFSKLFLQRSGDAHLDLVLAFPSRNTEKGYHVDEFEYVKMDTSMLKPIIGLFYSQSQRWRHFSLSAYDSFFHPGPLLPWVESLPSIVSMKFDAIHNTCDPWNRYTPLPNFKRLSAPSLRTLTLGRLAWRVNAPDDITAGPFECLQSLVISPDFLPDSALLRLASESTTVSLANFSDCSDPIDFKHPDSTITCLASALSINPIFAPGMGFHLGEILRSITLPNVTRLSFGAGVSTSSRSKWRPVQPVRFPTDQFLSLLHRCSADQITHLTINHYSFSNPDVDLVMILSRLPSLTHLEVDESPKDWECHPFQQRPFKPTLTSSFFEALVIHTPISDHTLVPQLREVSFSSQPFLNMTQNIGDVVANMLETRWRGGQSGLTRAKFSGFRSLLDMDEGSAGSIIKRLREEGMSLELGSFLDLGRSLVTLVQAM